MSGREATPAGRPPAREPVLLAADDDLLVVDKPAGWLVHAAGTADPDLVSWLTLQGHGHPAPVHRIDKETSGVVILARVSGVAAELGEALAKGEVGKTYHAVVHGRARKKGTIRRPLQEGRRHVDAVTRYVTEAWLGRFSLLRVHTDTGRKHQIRRHLQGLGHPLVGDDRYGPKRFVPVPGFPWRLWLHASEVALPDGRTYTAPLPLELETCLEALRAGAGEAPGTGEP